MPPWRRRATTFANCGRGLAAPNGVQGQSPWRGPGRSPEKKEKSGIKPLFPVCPGLAGFVAGADAFIAGFAGVTASAGCDLDTVEITAVPAFVVGAAGYTAANGLAACLGLGHHMNLLVFGKPSMAPKAGGHAGKNLGIFYKVWAWSHWARSWASGPGSWETAAARAWG